MSKGAKVVFWMMVGIVGAAVLLLAWWLAGAAPRPLWLVDFDITRVLILLMSIFVAALFVERAAEVIITVWREPGRADIEHWIAAVKKDPKVAVNSRRLAPDKALPDYEGALTVYKATTGRLAGVLTFTMGVAIACVGLRALNPLIDQTSFVGVSPLQRGLFNWLDAVITGAMIGGGSEGIHQMMKAIIAVFATVRKALEKPTE